MIRFVLPAAAAFGIALCAAAPAAHAQRFTPITGQQLSGLCSGRDKVRAQQCESYIAAVADTAGFYQRLVPSDGSKGGKLPGYVCVPESTTGVALRESFVRWLGAHPDAQGRQASGAVMDALYNTYPCK